MSTPIRRLVFSGGGIKGLIFVGCLRALEESGIMPHITSFAGTSAGSIMAMLFSLGYKYVELREIFLKMDYEKTHDINSDSIFNYFQNYGFETGNEIIRIMRIFVKRKLGNEHATFADAYRVTGKTLIITGTRLNTRECCYFSHTSHPDMVIVDAISISIAVPFIFIARHIGEDIYVDGGISDNYPLDAFDDKSDVLGFLLQGSHARMDIQGLDEYAKAMIQCVWGKLHSLQIQLYGDITVTIPSNESAFRVDLTEDDRLHLFELGYIAAKEYLDRNSSRIPLEDVHVSDDNSDDMRVGSEISDEIQDIQDIQEIPESVKDGLYEEVCGEDDKTSGEGSGEDNGEDSDKED